MCEIKRSSYHCYYCGMSLAGSNLLLRTKDHIVPISKGGKNCYDNKVTSCLYCNRKKNNKTLEEFLESTKDTEINSKQIIKLIAYRDYKGESLYIESKLCY